MSALADQIAQEHRQRITKLSFSCYGCDWRFAKDDPGDAWLSFRSHLTAVTEAAVRERVEAAIRTEREKVRLPPDDEWWGDAANERAWSAVRAFKVAEHLARGGTDE